MVQKNMHMSLNIRTVRVLSGKELADKILAAAKEKASRLKKPLRLAIAVAGKDPVVAKFIEQKRQAARKVGIRIRIYSYPDAITTNNLRKRLARVVHEEKNTGIIIQLPLPPNINTQYILNSIPLDKDVDVLSARSVGNFAVGKNAVMPPVAGAARMILNEYGIDYRGKRIVIAGAGSLVGRPVALWLLSEGVSFSVLTKESQDPVSLLREADIIISGMGSPGFITGEMVKEGVVVIDAGTSESAGRVVGDVDFESVSAKASCITPVPGGIGPVTVALLMDNLVTLALRRNISEHVQDK